MFESLYFKDVLDEEVGKCLTKRYEGSKVNDRSLGRMYYLKQFSKYADEMYNQLRAKIDHKDAVDRKIVANDSCFSATAQMRQGSSKIDRDKMIDAVVKLLQAQVDPETGVFLWTGMKARVRAAEIVDHCTVIGKGSTVISVVENASA